MYLDLPLESPRCKAKHNKFSFVEKLKQVYRYNLPVALSPDKWSCWFLFDDLLVLVEVYPPPIAAPELRCAWRNS